MIYYKCLCGKHEFWGSGMEPAPCKACDECGKTLATGPSEHKDPISHDFSMKEVVNTDEGPKTLTCCRYCFQTKTRIEQQEAEKAKKQTEAKDGHS